MSRRDKGAMAPEKTIQMSPRRKRLFAAFTLMTFATVLVILEILLRVFNYGSEYDLVCSVSERGKQSLSINPIVGKRYFDPNRYALPKVERTLFDAQKSPTTFRVFCLGASTTVGFPYSYNLTPSFILKKQLEVALPDMKIEVVNAGLTATSSFTVVEFTRELVAYNPDLFVIYTGQNDFYGALGAASTVSVGQYRWVTTTYLALRRFKSFILLEESISGISHLFFGGRPEKQSGTLMQQMADDKAIAYGSPLYRRALETYRSNLEAAMAIAQEHGIPVVLSTVVTNERSLPPFVSLHRSDLASSTRSEIDALNARGDTLLAQKQYSRALDAFRASAARDAGYAMTQFRIGQCCEALGLVDSARVAFGAARDLDGLRFRASGEMNGIIRSVAQTSHAVIADIDSAFRAHSPGGLPGRELLWEHVHPTLDGYMLLSRTWYKAMASVAFRSAGLSARLRTSLSDSTLRSAIGYTELDAEFAAQTMQRLLNRWPFTAAAGSDAIVPRNDVERVASLFNNGTLRWNESHYELADAFLKEKNLAAAAREYEAVHAFDPDDPFPLTRMGDMYALMEKQDKAVEAFTRVLEITESQFVHLKLGVTLAKSGASEQALVHLNRAFELESGSTSHFSRAQFGEATYFYALSLFRTGRVDEARQTLSVLVENEPGNEKAVRLLTEIKRR
ncbi:MAG TPA: tetratricopeptide repeat protein [Bacteroidota bacterium]|nr:tetratricopeptide repeat protein [Bacteroidota bacterium]